MSITKFEKRIMTMGLMSMVLAGSLGATFLNAKINAMEIENSAILKDIKAGTDLVGGYVPKLNLKLTDEVLPNTTFYLKLDNAKWIDTIPTVSAMRENFIASEDFDVQVQSDKLLKVTYTGDKVLDNTHKIVVDLYSKVLGGDASVSVITNSESLIESQEVFSKTKKPHLTTEVSNPSKQLNYNKETKVKFTIKSNDDYLLQQGHLITLRFTNGYIPYDKLQFDAVDFENKLNLPKQVKLSDVKLENNYVTSIILEIVEDANKLNLELPIMAVSNGNTRTDVMMEVSNSESNITQKLQIGSTSNPLGLSIRPTILEYTEENTIKVPEYNITEIKPKTIQKGELVFQLLDKDGNPTELSKVPEVSKVGDIELGHVKGLYKDNKLVAFSVDVLDVSNEFASTVFVSDLELNNVFETKQDLTLSVTHRTSDTSSLIIKNKYVEVLPNDELDKQEPYEITRITQPKLISQTASSPTAKIDLQKLREYTKMDISDATYNNGVLTIKDGNTIMQFKQGSEVMFINGIRVGKDDENYKDIFKTIPTEEIDKIIMQ